MLTLLAMRIGFFGQTGLLWALIGFVCYCVVIGIIWKIANLVLPKLGVDPTWIQVIYWVFVLVLFIAFVNFAFGLGW